MKNLLKITFLIDGVIAIGFGAYSYFAPLATFGTIIAIPTTDNELILTILASMSILYVLIGLVCFVGIQAGDRTAHLIGLLMITRHGLMGVLKYLDIGQEWLIGNPYPDLIIHTLFLVAYLFSIYGLKRSSKMKVHN